MIDPEPMRIRMVSLVGWALALVLVVGGLGGFPTWTWQGNAGLWSLCVAAAVGFGGALFGGRIICRAAQAGPTSAATAFLPSELYRLGFGVVVGAVAGVVAPVSLVALVIWLLIFHLIMMYSEVVWLVKALRRDERLVEAGRVIRLFRPGGLGREHPGDTDRDVDLDEL